MRITIGTCLLGYVYAHDFGLVHQTCDRFHPAIKRVKAIIDSREIGEIQNITVEMQLPKGFLGDDDIRYDYELGGGAMMDLGCTSILLHFSASILC